MSEQTPHVLGKKSFTYTFQENTVIRTDRQIQGKGVKYCLVAIFKYSCPQ